MSENIFSQYEFEQNIENLLSNAHERQQSAAWKPIIQQLLTLNQVQLMASSLSVFTLFSAHFHANEVDQQGRLVPEHILAKFADTYHWLENKEQLSSHFSASEIDCVLNYASLSQNLDLISPNEVPVKSSNKHPMRRNVIIAILIFSGYCLYQASKPEQITPPPAKVLKFDARLLACNNLYSAEPTEDFETCLSLAKEGKIDAQKRIIWAYSRSGDYLDWQQAYNWLKVSQKYDRNAFILSFAVLHFMGNSQELKESGERGIIRLANQNNATANILLASMYALDTNVLPRSSNPLWLLERAYQSAPELLPPIEMASILVNGYFSSPEIDKAKAVLTSAANKYFPNGTNNVAWFLSTLDTNPITEPEYAISLAQSIIDDPKFTNTHTYIDTLAATYAANNEFDLALSTQQKAIDAIANLTISEEDKQRLIDDFSARLQRYRQGKPVVESRLVKDKTEFFSALQKQTINRLLNGFYQKITVPEGAELISQEAQNVAEN